MADETATPFRGRLAIVERGLALLLGLSPSKTIPARVHHAIQEEQDQSELLVCSLQIIAIVTFAGLYILTPKAFPPDVPFEPVPVTLAVYAAFTLVRFWLAITRRLTPWFLSLSVIVDIAVLMVTIWSFHLQYQTPAALYLKAPTLMYVFILIALRTLRFEPGYVLLAGGTAALGWLAMIAYAVRLDPAAELTHDFRVYTTSYAILIGAEFDKVVSIVMVTIVLAIALTRARKLLVRATTEHQAAAELSRFFAPEVANRIRETEASIAPGQAELRDAAILMTDLRGFTDLASRTTPSEVMQLLSAYQSRVVDIVTAHGGSIDKFIGDGILASFGAATPGDCCAADALRAVDDILAWETTWRAARRTAGHPAPSIGVAVATGRVMFGAIGHKDRLEYTIIGEPVNVAAKLEKHTAKEGGRAVYPAGTYEMAHRQGYQLQRPVERRRSRNVEGLASSMDLMVLQ